MARDINFDGTEISILKALGTGSDVSGSSLAAKVSELPEAEVIDVTKGLVAMGYVVTDSPSLNSSEDFRAANFQINSGYSREIREALDPQPQRPKSKRVRRE